MLERAAQKLRLYQLVIQQGRTHAAKGVYHNNDIEGICLPFFAAVANKGELLEMITHGAEKIINSSDEYCIPLVTLQPLAENFYFTFD